MSAPRLPDSQLVEGLRHLLLDRHHSRDTSATGERLMAELREAGVPVGCVRRVQEGVRFLRLEFARGGRTLTIASDGSGYWLEQDPQVIRLSLISAKRRVARSAEVIRFMDPDLYDRLTLALDLDGRAA